MAWYSIVGVFTGLFAVTGGSPLWTIDCSRHPCEIACGGDGRNYPNLKVMDWFVENALVKTWPPLEDAMDDSNNVLFGTVDRNVFTFVAYKPMTVVCKGYSDVSRETAIVQDTVDVKVLVSERFCIVGQRCSLPVLPSQGMTIVASVHGTWSLNGNLVAGQTAQSRLLFDSFELTDAGRYVHLGSNTIMTEKGVSTAIVSTVLNVVAVVTVVHRECYVNLKCVLPEQNSLLRYPVDGIGMSPITAVTVPGIFTRYGSISAGFYKTIGSDVVYNVSTASLPPVEYISCGAPGKYCYIICTDGELFDVYSAALIPGGRKMVGNDKGWIGVSFLCIMENGSDRYIRVTVTDTA